MTLEQAIEHAERAYKESRNGLQYALKRGETKFAERCKKDVEKYRRLTALLRELQERRKAPEIVRCGECKHYKIDHPKANGYHCCYRCHNIFPMKEDDFCSRAERRTDENNNLYV